MEMIVFAIIVVIIFFFVFALALVKAGANADKINEKLFQKYLKEKAEGKNEEG
jgi:hypothetical protein